jgi:hypothetical protein
MECGISCRNNRLMHSSSIWFHCLVCLPTVGFEHFYYFSLSSHIMTLPYVLFSIGELFLVGARQPTKSGKWRLSIQKQITLVMYLSKKKKNIYTIGRNNGSSTACCASEIRRLAALVTECSGRSSSSHCDDVPFYSLSIHLAVSLFRRTIRGGHHHHCRQAFCKTSPPPPLIYTHKWREKSIAFQKKVKRLDLNCIHTHIPSCSITDDHVRDPLGRSL